MLGAALLGAVNIGFPVLSAETAFGAPATARVPSGFQSSLDRLARRAKPGIFGIVVLDLETGRTWEVNADRAFPMMSVFKAPLGAAILARIDAGKISPSETIEIKRSDLRLGASRIARDFRGDSMTFTVDQLLAGAVSYSDNTAADALVKLVGGPQALTAYLRDHGIDDMHVDLDERGIEHVFSGLGSEAGPPANETAKEREDRRWRGFQAFLGDPRNRSTPIAAAEFLQKLWHGELLSKRATRELLDLMYGQTVPARLSAGLPAGVRLAHKSGTSLSMRGVTAAFNDIGILTWPDGHAVVVAAFLTGSHASRAERSKLFADLARETAAAFHP
jgi:beta-lactamase class A